MKMRSKLTSISQFDPDYNKRIIWQIQDYLEADIDDVLHFLFAYF